MLKKQICRIFALVLLCLVFTGCQEERLRPGEVARVNGRPITFALLEAAHHGAYSKSSPEIEMPSLEVLRAEYSAVLFQLICQELVCEYMEQKGSAVTKEEVAAEEALIQEDYPPGGFELMLQEEGIDIHHWRELQYMRLNVERFQTQYLRPDIPIPHTEIENYYKEHSKDLFLPEQWHFMQIYGPDEASVKEAAEVFRESKNATLVLEHNVSLREIRMDKDRIPEDLLKILSSLSAWAASTVRKYESSFTSFVMIEKVPQAVRDATETFFLMEQALVEDKLLDAYADWLRKRLLKSTVKVAEPLAPLDTTVPPPPPEKSSPKKGEGDKENGGSASGGQDGAIKNGTSSGNTGKKSSGAGKTPKDKTSGKDGSARKRGNGQGKSSKGR